MTISRSIFLFLCVTLPAGAAAAPPKMYVVQQMRAGAIAYATSCASCHGASLQGITGPKLVGQAFAKAEDHYSLALVFTNLWEGTPAGDPDSLSKTQYVDIMAFLMAKNGFPAGPVPLSFSIASRSTLAFVSQVP